ncbi:hypothetical protein CHS0354_035332 [Potamilus streckersoni]|uniref:UvrABC system protein B n=1 Tax=Potamilus streckersoni TaxID=2493646 RepID=A0AAE0VNM2_9BIVA|nr:hypothetical protein CHS0354_035332 [Potamilus streckersoni]
MAEDLTDYYKDLNVRVRYMHSEIDTIERTDILRDLRMGEFDVLVGINLLREGLDLPEVSLVAIFDADKEGFLRSYRSLIQTFGRAARHINGKVILYADRITDSMSLAIDETDRRRTIQIDITAHTIQSQMVKYEPETVPVMAAEENAAYGKSPAQVEVHIKKLDTEMRKLAKQMEFEKAAKIRDEIKYWKEFQLGIIEAILFSASHPVSLRRISEITSAKIPVIKEAVDRLDKFYRRTKRAFYIHAVAGGLQLRTDAAFAPLVGQNEGVKIRKFSRAALETLSVIAYKHRSPVHLLKLTALLPGRPILYGTTDYFLEIFGFNSLADLPSPEELNLPSDFSDTEDPKNDEVKVIKGNLSDDDF